MDVQMFNAHIRWDNYYSFVTRTARCHEAEVITRRGEQEDLQFTTHGLRPRMSATIGHVNYEIHIKR